jgi:hypothetical protein
MSDKASDPRRRKGEEGAVLLMVVLLVVVFSGLGLMAMRYTRGELRSAGAYMDSAQAAAAAEAAILMVATDMRRNWRASNSEATCKNYYDQFQEKVQEAASNDDTVASDFAVGFSDAFNQEGDCSHAGSVPFDFLRGETGAPLALTGGPMASGFASVQLSQAEPQLAPPPPGFSSDDESRTYEWYYFSVRSLAAYGPHAEYGSETTPAPSVTRGHAEVRAEMKIGPIDAIRSN